MVAKAQSRRSEARQVDDQRRMIGSVGAMSANMRIAETVIPLRLPVKAAADDTGYGLRIPFRQGRRRDHNVRFRINSGVRQVK